MTLDEVLAEMKKQSRVFGGQRCLTEFQAEQLVRLAWSTASGKGYDLGYKAGKRDAGVCGCRNGVHRCGR